MRRQHFLLAAAAAAALGGVGALAGPAFGRQDEPADDKTPPHPLPPTAKNVVVLFSGKPEELAANWNNTKWKVTEDGAMQVTPGGGEMGTKEKFQDFQLHLEFKVPYMPNEKGQGRGNSGVFLQSRYEIQVLDSFGWEKPGKADCGAIYNKSAPLVNACKPPRQWQTYDITFRSARIDAEGKVTEPARATVILNGVVVQNNTPIIGVTGAAEDTKEGTPGRLRLQDHGNPMQFRNIWIMPLPQEGSSEYGPK